MTNQQLKHMKRLRPVMFAGTGSDVGKSVLAAGFCRIFRQDGYSPAPFKAQNMALNSFATPEGLEIGRAQAVQAEACGIAPCADMNPILLKPLGDSISQIVLNGRSVTNVHARDYYEDSRRDMLRAEVCNAFDRLAAAHSPVVIEGAGSVAELNLRNADIVNISMARHAGAAVILVADIERGGVFASAYGSVMLQQPEDRRLIKGIIVNKFRGDATLFDNGRKILEDICGVPVLGVVPYFDNIHIEEEDSMELAAKKQHATTGSKVNVAVVKLSHISNFTDFDMLEHDARVNLYYCDDAHELDSADIIILPGSKNTLSDLARLRATGMAEAITEAAHCGKTVFGICGGYQMMGATVADPHGIEGPVCSAEGLSLLPVSTRLEPEKTLRQSDFTFASGRSGNMTGYEIHNGVTSPTGLKPCKPLFVKADGSSDGCVCGANCMGTYMHGVLDNPPFVDFLLATCGKAVGSEGAISDYKAFKDRQYDMLADFLRQHVDMRQVYSILAEGAE